jgi:hypothetical protein
MIAVLSIREIIGRQIGPRNDNLIINAIQFHVLETPTLIDSSWNVFLPETRKVGCVVHTHFYTVPKLRDKRSKQGST